MNPLMMTTTNETTIGTIQQITTTIHQQTPFGSDVSLATLFHGCLAREIAHPDYILVLNELGC